MVRDLANRLAADSEVHAAVGRGNHLDLDLKFNLKLLRVLAVMIIQRISAASLMIDGILATDSPVA